MSARFVIGRAGSGKTRHCIHSIAAMLREAPLGAPIFWLLPRSATFQAERALACEAGLKGFFRCRVLSIESFVQTVLEESGGAGAAEISPSGRRMILGHLLRHEAGELKYFRASATWEGLARRVDATFSEIDAGASDDGWPDDTLAGEDPVLAAKLADLRHLYEAYNAYVGQDRLDPRRHMGQLLERIHACPLLKGAVLFVDGFTHFSSGECRILAAAAAAAERAEVTLMMDSRDPLLDNPHRRIDEFSLFHPTSEAYQQLWFALSEARVTFDPPLRLEGGRRFSAAPVLSEVEQLFAGGASPPPQPDGGLGELASLSFIEAADRAAEVDAAARRIQDWLAQGLRLRQIAVLGRDLENYDDLIAASFTEHDIPFFLDRRRSAGHHPLPQLLGEALRIARDNWPRDAVVAFLKSGLTPLSPEESDQVENYALAHRIRGAGWASERPWDFIIESGGDEDHPAEPTEGQKELAGRVDALRRKVFDPLRPFVRALRQGEQTVARIIGELRQLLRRVGAAERLALWIQQAGRRDELELAAEHQRIWDETLSLLAQMEQLLGDQTLKLDDFIALFQSALEEFDLALTPPTLDQVLVGQLERTVTPQVRAVVVLGLNEGTFPAVSREDSILNDADRRMLRRLRFNVEADTRRRLLDERFLGYLAFTRASERLCLTRPRSQTDGKAVAPSVFWQELRKHFPHAPLEAVTSRAGECVQIGTPRELVTGLMLWVRDAGEMPVAPRNDVKAIEASAAAITAAEPLFPELYQWFAADRCDAGAIDRLRVQAWKALSYQNKAVLPQATARLLFAPADASAGGGTASLQATGRELESFAACPFQHFAEFGLNLKARRQDEEVTPLDLHHVYHRILRKLVRHLLERRTDWPHLQKQASEPLIARFAHEVGVALKNEWMLSSGRNQYLLDRVARMVEQFVARQRAAAARGHFSPAHADLAFSRGAKLAPLTVPTPGGNTLQLRGTIDRVDLLESGAAAVTDYRLTGRTLVLGEVMHGLSLQLLISLLALRSGGERICGKRVAPAAAFYLQLLRKLQSVGHPEEAGDPSDPKFDLRLKPRGILDQAYLRDLDHQLVDGSSPVVSAFLKKDGTCGHLSKTDAATSEQLTALLDRVESLAGQLADRILQGDIAIRPYRMGEITPCPRCAFKPLCRFDPAMDNYHHLMPMAREQVLKELTGNGGGTK